MSRRPSQLEPGWEVEDAHARERSLFATLLHTVGFPASLTRMPQGTILGVNGPFLDLFECARVEVIGRTSVELGFVDAESAARVSELLHEHASVRNFECTRRTKTGAIRKLSLCIDWLDVGGASYLFTVIHDITPYKRTEEALRADNERLAGKVRRRSELLSVLAHELRHPLTPVRNSLYVLGRVAPGGEQARRAQAVIERQVDRLTRLVDELLDMTRIQGDQVRLHRERLDLDALARSTVTEQRPTLAHAGLDLVGSDAREPCWVQADRTRLAQVIANLIENTASLTPAGGEVRVSVARDAARATAVLSVSGAGREGAGEIVPKLFEVFGPPDSVQDRSPGTLGLGLAIARGLVELHGGELSVSTDVPGRGVGYGVRLPLDLSEGPAREEGLPVAVAPRRIFVIEDDLDAAESLRDALELSGHVVDVALSGPQGIERARSFAPDVVVCDVGLPGMDGYEVVRSLRADPALGRVRTVALTAYAHPEDAARSKAAGFDAYLAKPPDVRAIEDLLARLGPRDPG